MKHKIEQEAFIMPTNMAELQKLLNALWDDIFDNNNISKIDLYNQAAALYNSKARFGAITIITNFKKQKEMATSKKAATAVEEVKPAKKAVAKKAVATTTTTTTTIVETPLPQEQSEIVEAKVKKAKKEVVEDAPKKRTQKEIIVELADQGKTIDEIVTATEIKKTNVQWWFSKLGYSKKTAKVETPSE